MKNSSKISLIKYSNPFLIYQGSQTSQIQASLNLEEHIPIKKSQFNRKIKPSEWIHDLENTNNIEEVLNAIILTRVIVEADKIWLQTPVSFPATTIDVIRLKENLEENLIENNAKGFGLCPIREEFYFQCFDEIVRQVVINYKKRGLLLFCVKEHFKESIEAYKQ